MKPDPKTSNLTELVTRVAHVRRRLVVLAILRSLALLFIALALYLTLFAWLDHRVHFSVAVRCTALLMLVTIVLGLGVASLRRIWISLGLKQAASHVESARHYHQQLLATVEYYQRPADYPYSPSLVHAMMRQLWAEAKDDDFSSTVPSGRLWLFVTGLLLGWVAAGWFGWHHSAYWSRYAARLGRPTASLEPLPATRLRSLNGDIAVEPNEIVILQAAIEGRLPRTGRLVIEARKESQGEAASGEPAYGPARVLTLQPIEGAAGAVALFQGTTHFSEEGLYRYQFAAAGGETPWHVIHVCTFPGIQKITARISFNAGSQRSTIDETVTDYVLSALAGSQAEITVQANRLLHAARVKLLDDRTELYDVNGSDRFTFVTLLDHDGRFEFHLQDMEGLSSKELPALTIKIKEDKPPQFALRHPQGDGLATHVASVPIQFEITDDLGIAAATLNLEFGNGRSERIPVAVDGAARSAKIDHVLELEDYDLDVGDTVLFYADATDVATGPAARSRPAKSDVVFLEIKPYRKKWIQCPDGSLRPGGSAPLDPSLVHGRLLDILEYTRAFLKKTWRLANQDRLGEGDSVKLAALARDIDYAGENLRLIRDDPRYRFASSDIETIDGVLSEFASARHELMGSRVQNAIPPETRAYRAMRRLVDDRIQGDLKAGGPVVKEHPDKIELNEVQHLTRLERAQVAWQLNAMSQQLAEVARQQETLDRTFMHFLDAPPASNERARVNDEKSWVTDAPPPGPPNQTPSGSAGQGPAQDRTVEGALSPGSCAATPENFSDVMRLLRAHQRQLRAELASLEEQLARMPVGQDPNADHPDPIETRKTARAHMNQAQTEMNQFETLLAEQYYDPPDVAKLVRDAPPMLNAIRNELVMARQALHQEAGSYRQDDAEQLRQMALNLEALANAYEKAVTPESRRQLLNELSAVAAQFNAMSGGPANISGGTRSVGAGPVVSVKGYGDRDIVNAARFAAQRFLPENVDANQRSDNALPEASSGSLRFYDQENDFFESTAQNRPQR